MGLFDAFGTDAPYDPGQGVDDLARQVFPDDVGPGDPVDPGRLEDALARRQDRKTRHIDAKPPEVKPPSAFGDIVKSPGAITKPPSAYGDLVEPDQAPLGVAGNAKALLKGIPAGALESTGGVIKGVGTLVQQAQPTIDAMGDANSISNQFSGAINNPQALAQQRAAEAQQAAQQAQHPLGPSLIGAGNTVQQFGKDNVPMSDAENESIAGRVGKGIGSIAPYAAATLIGGPALGIAAGFTGMAADTYGSAYEDAIKAGASEEVARSVAGKSALAAGVLGSLPLGAGKYAKSLISKVASSSAAFATAGEAQEAILQQIRKEYDPKAGYTFDQKRLIAELILGAGMGGLHHAFERKPGEPPPAPDDTAPNAPNSGSLPPGGPDTSGGRDNGPQPSNSDPGNGANPGAGPEPGAGNGPKPGSGGPGASNAGTGPQSGPKPGGPPPGTGEGKGQDFKMDARMRAKFEKLYRTFGGDPTGLADHELFNALNEHMRDTSSTGHTAKPETPEEATARQEAATERTEREGLIRKGWPESLVRAMSPAERRRRYQEAMAGSPASERPPETGRGNTAPKGEEIQQNQGSGSRDNPIAVKTADDVVRAGEVAASPTEAQAQAENYRHGHVEIEHLGLTGKNSISVETGVGGTRDGVGPDGKRWSVKMEHAAYGRIKSTVGADGEPLDIFIGPHPTSPHVFVVNQHDPDTGKWDEHKILAGFTDPISAMHAYANSFTDGASGRIGGVVAYTPGQFKAWLKLADHTKPADYPNGLQPPWVKQHPVIPDPAKRPAQPEQPTKPASEKPTDRSPPEKTYAEPVSAANPAARSPLKPTSDEPLNLLQFIVSKGGLKTKGVKYGPDLVAMDAHKHIVSMPKGHKGFPALVSNKRGMAPDDMASLAQQHFYWPKDDRITGDHLVEAVRAGIAKKHRYPEGHEDHQPKSQDGLDAEREAHAKARDNEDYGAARIAIADAGYVDLPSDVREAAARIMADEGETDPDIAVERASVRLVAADHDYEVTRDDIADTFGHEAPDEIHPETAHEDGRSSPHEGEEPERPEESEKAEGDGGSIPDAGEEGREEPAEEVDDLRDSAWAIRQRKKTGKPVDESVNEALRIADQIDATEPESAYADGIRSVVALGHDIKPTDLNHYLKSLADKLREKREAGEQTEAGADNKPQTVIPGAEKAGDGKLAQRGADAKLKPRVAQKAADDGLFGDSHKQTDLMDFIQPSAKHHADIDKALGPDADAVLPVDKARAAELLANNDGMDPTTAFGQAVVENLAGQKFIPEPEIEKAYGPEVETVLDPGRKGASGSGASIEQERPAPGQVGSGRTGETEVAARGGEAGASGKAEGADASADAGNPRVGTAVKPAAGGNETAGDEAGDTAQDKPAAENADEPLKAPASDHVKRASAILAGDPVRAVEFNDRERDANRQIAVNLDNEARGKWRNASPGPVYAAARDAFLRAIANRVSILDIKDQMMAAAGEAAEKSSHDNFEAHIAGLESVEPEAAKPKSVSDIFDDVMDEEFGEKTEKAKPTAKKVRAPAKPKEPTAADRRAARDAPTWAEVLHAGNQDADAIGALISAVTGKKKWRFDDLTPAQKHELLKRVSGEQKPPAPKPMGLDDVAKGLGAIFGKKPTGLAEDDLSLDDSVYEQALPFFRAGAAHFEGDLPEAVRGLVRHLREAGMTPDAIREMKPHILRFVSEVESGKVRIGKEGESSPRLDALADKYGVPQVARKIAGVVRDLEKKQKRAAGLLSLIDQLHDRLNVLVVHDDAPNQKTSLSDIADAGDVGSIHDFAKELAKEGHVKDVIGWNEKEDGPLNTHLHTELDEQQRQEFYSLKGRLEALYEKAVNLAPEIRKGALEATKLSKDLAKRVSKMSNILDEDDDVVGDKPSDVERLYWDQAQSFIVDDGTWDSLEKMADHASFLARGGVSDEFEEYLKGKKEDLDEEAAELRRWNSLTDDEQEAELATKKADREKKDAEYKRQVEGAVDQALARGWRPEVNRFGGWPRPPEIAGFASPQASDIIRNRLQAKGFNLNPSIAEDDAPFDKATYREALPFLKAGAGHFKAAGDVTDMVRGLIRHLTKTGMSPDALRAMKPYIVRFIEDVRSGKENLDASGSGDVLEPDRGNATPGNGVGKADVPAATGTTGRSPGAGGKTTARGGDGPADGVGVPENYAPVVGADGHIELPARQPEHEGGDAAAGKPGRGAADGEERLPFERTSTEQTIEHARKEADLTARRENQRRAENAKVIPGDIGNIADTLPMLFPEQHDDVRKAEERFAKPDGHGMLFTNGTGTGKTYSGLGVIKRMAMQGKKNTLIVAPSQGILTDWVKSAKDLGLDVSVLGDTQDKGKGIVATTYANMGANRHLVDRGWDLVVADEAHKLSSDQNGTTTAALRTLRAITLHPDGLRARAEMVLRDEYDAAERLPKGSTEWHAAYSAFEKKAGPLIEQWRTEHRPKTLMMSATPFAYHFSLDYAEGYLFEHDRDRDGGGYNSVSGRNAFYVQHLGYRMRTNKLTKPDADVRAEVMERQLHEYLKRQGSLSGRALTVDKDYDRKFLLVDDAIGNQIDQALEFLQDADEGKFRPLYDMVAKKFDYLTRMRLLEAIKAQHAVPYIQKSLALGRKVVVFHDYNEGGGISPFVLDIPPNVKISVGYGENATEVKPAELYQEFIERNPWVKNLQFSNLQAPIYALQQAFPNALIYNGTVSNKIRNEAKRLFNDDNSGRDIIIVQSAAGEAGISLHDTTGRKQRVTVNLGMPVRPTTSIQQEGRTYRVGQASDAIFRYMNTGTSWERWTFAGKIAERAGTAENLALGDIARTIKQSYVDAFNNADNFDPEPGEGKGGKVADAATTHSISEFEKAKTHYFGQGKNTKRRDQREGVDYFATPEPIGLKMVEFANIKPGEKILEPSAGHGAISRYFPEDTARTLVEPSSSLAGRAALSSPGARAVVDRFENLNVPANKFDAIVMNPPFGVGGKTAIEHLAKAATHLKNGGRIVALIPRGGMADNRLAALRLKLSDLAVGIYLVGDIDLPAVTFERAGTSALTHIVVFEKHIDWETARKLPQVKTRDYSDIEKIGDLFDRIEHFDMGQRLEPKTKDVDIPTEGNVTIAGVEFKLKSLPNKTMTASLETRVGSGRYRDLAQAAQAAGGRVSGKDFVFDEAEARQAFLDAVANPPKEAPAAATAPSGVKFKTGETVHAKTKGKLFVATPTARTDRSTYDAMVVSAKKYGGYYSSYDKLGAIPGFQFKSAEDRQKFLDEQGGKVPEPPNGTEPPKGSPKVDASPDDHVAPGARAQDHVLARGHETGNEHLVAIDIRGNEIASYAGSKGKVYLTPALQAALMNSNNNIVVHHNHPQSRSFSGSDISLLGTPGLHSLWAHGHNGNGHRASLTGAARNALKDDPSAINRLTQVYEQVSHRIKNPIQNEIARNPDVVDRANEVHAHIVNEVLRDAGIIDYQTNADAGTYVRDVPGLHDAIIAATENARKGFFRDKAPSDVGRASTIRHVGDVGAVFGRSAGRAGLRGEGDRGAERQADDPGEEALSLGSPDSIFEKRTRGNTRVSRAIGGLFNPSRKADLVEALSDLSHREKLLQKEVEARYLGLTPEEAKKVFPEASNLPDAMQFYVKKELIPGKVAHQANDFRTRLLKPLIETANRAKITLPDLGDYLLAKGALERNRNTAPLYEPGHPFNDAMRDNSIAGGSGFSNNEARDKIRQFEDGPQGNAFKSIWRQTRNVVDFTRQMMVHYGLESQATVDAWKVRGPDYVPFKGFEEADIDDEKYFGGKGSPIGIRAPESKRAFGRTSKADNPMVHLIDQAYRTIERGERNQHYNSIAETLATLKASGINVSDFVSLNKGAPKQVVDNRTGLARWIDTSPSAMAKGAVNFKRNGAPRTMLFKSEKLAQSIKRNSPWTFPGLRHVLLGVNKLKSLWTHYSPDFAARHFFGRYMVEGALNAYQLKDTGAYSPSKWVADAFPGIGRASRAIVNQEKGRPSGQLGAYWAEMKAGGGSMAFRAMRDIDTIKNELVEDLKQITTRSRLNPLRVLKGITEKTDEIFNVWDNATRLATYAQARDQGMTPQAAAYRSRNATVNYQKRANLSSFIGTLMPFYNTAVRTGTRLSGALTQSHTMRKVAVGVFAAGVALALNNYLLGGNDDNGVPYFEKVPPYERALGFIFLNPFERDEKGRPQKYALPNAYNYALPMTLGYHLTGMLLDKAGAIKSTISVGEHLLEAVKSTLMAFTPLGEFGNLMDLITPELLRPIAHVIENKNWLGNPVHNDMFQKGPNSESGRKAHGDYEPTGEGWKDTAKAINSVTGGDQHHSGLIDMYPEDIRELADQMFGAQKRFGIEVGRTAGSIMKGEVPKATDVPIARVFRGIDYDQADAVERAKHRYEQKHPWQNDRRD